VATRSVTKPIRNDPAGLTPKDILSMSQNELLDCILTRLEELEYSQSRTSLQVRVLTRRLIREKHAARCRNIAMGEMEDNENSDYYDETLKSPYEEDLEQDLELMMNGDGEDEAILLASMRQGPLTHLAYEQMVA
jgi:hypothetical protein